MKIAEREEQGGEEEENMAKQSIKFSSDSLSLSCAVLSPDVFAHRHWFGSQARQAVWRGQAGRV